MSAHNRKFVADIIDLFDEWLDDKGVRIENEERDYADPYNGANIYGEDFDYLTEGIINILKSEGIDVGWDYN